MKSAVRLLSLLPFAALPLAPLPLFAAVPPEKGAEILALRNVGLAQLEEDKPAEARKSFEKLAGLVPDDPLPPANAAVAALRTNDLAGAEALVKKALSLAPDRSDLLMIQAALENARNRPTETRALLARAAAASPRNLEARWRWVRVAEADPAGKVAPAEKARWLAEIIAASPSNIPALAKLALVQCDAGDAAAAKTTLGQLESTLAPLDPKIAKYIGEAKPLLAAGNTKEAGLKLRVVENLLRVGDRYRASLMELYTDVVGLPVVSFSPKFEESLRPKAGAPIPVSFAEKKGEAKEARPRAAPPPRRLEEQREGRGLHGSGASPAGRLPRLRLGRRPRPLPLRLGGRRPAPPEQPGRHDRRRHRRDRRREVLVAAGGPRRLRPGRRHRRRGRHRLGRAGSPFEPPAGAIPLDRPQGGGGRRRRRRRPRRRRFPRPRRRDEGGRRPPREPGGRELRTGCRRRPGEAAGRIRAAPRPPRRPRQRRLRRRRRRRGDGDPPLPQLRLPHLHRLERRTDRSREGRGDRRARRRPRRRSRPGDR